MAPHDRLLRRVLHSANFLVWHDDLSRWVPSLAAIRFDPDGMSVFVRELLEQEGDGVGDVGTLGGTNDKPAVVYQVQGRAVTDAGFTAALTPNTATPIGYAHASVFEPAGLPRPDVRRARAALAMSMTLVHGVVTLARPDGHEGS